MRSFSLTLLVALSSGLSTTTARWFNSPDTSPPPPSPGHAATLDDWSNADRLQWGMAPRRPSRLYSPDRRSNHRRALPSGKPTVVNKGFVYTSQPGQQAQGCMISDGSWYIGGTCATYTQTLTDDSFTLDARGGPCAIVDGAFSCASGNPNTVFTLGPDGTVQYQGSSQFSAKNVPPSNQRETVYAGNGNDVALILKFTSNGATPSSPASSSASSSTSSAPYPTGTGLTVCDKPASSYPLSCGGGGSQDTCCYDNPGGLVLLTQFWDTGSTSTGPNNSWTLHGLWPDNCDGTYEQYCDPSRENYDIRGTLESFGQSDLLATMDKFWKDYQGDDEDFWEHEWNKHGTCYSSLEPRCFNNYTKNEDLVTYFQRTVSTFQNLPTYEWLAAEGITPSLDKTYTLSAIKAALTNGFGHEPIVNCRDGAMDEVWYFHNSQGGIPSGELIRTDLTGSPSDCPATGIKYYPKYTDLSGGGNNGGGDGTPTSSSPGSTPTGAPGSQPTIGERGFVYPTKSDGTRVSGACMINAGVWYQGTCGGYFAEEASSPDLFKLKTNSGYCSVDSDSKIFSCPKNAGADSGSEFAIDTNGVISYGGSTVFSAGQQPSGQTKVDIHADGSESIALTLVYAGGQ